MPEPTYDVFEVEEGRWSYRFGDVPSGEVYPSRAAAMIAAEQTHDKLLAAPAPKDEAGGAPARSGGIETLDRDRSGR